MTDAPKLDIPPGGWKRCKGCAAAIVFVPAYTTGKVMPLQLDSIGEWKIEDGNAKHIGPPPAQTSLLDQPVTRWTSHFAICPKASEFRGAK
jgi:hypothetical protein